jgi:hypothetical protein
VLQPISRYITARLLIGGLIGLALRLAVPGSIVRHKNTVVRPSQQRGENSKKEHLQRAAAPQKWKSGLLTFVPAYLIGTALEYTPIAQLPVAIANFIVTLLLVSALTYIILPLLTRWLSGWLVPPPPPQEPEPLYLNFLKYKRRQRHMKQQATRVYFY